MNFIKRFQSISRKSKRTLLGLMSGMSMDGLNMALVTIQGKFPKLKIDLLESETVIYPSEVRKKLMHARSGDVYEITALNFELANMWSDLILDFFRKKRVK